MKIPFKCREIIYKLSNNGNVVLFRQDKGGSTVVIDRKKHTQKYIDMLETKQFRKLHKDPTKTIETNVRRAPRKIKDHLAKSEYQTLYPS